MARGALIVCAMVATSSSARGQDPPNASALAERAAARAAAGDRFEAIRLYDAAYRADNRPDFLCAIGEQHEALAVALGPFDEGDVRAAIRSYEACLSSGGPRVGAGDNHGAPCPPS
jgi:hypothetical protein